MCYTEVTIEKVTERINIIVKREIQEKQFHIGEVYLMKFGGRGNEQQGWRPGIVFQNNVGNAHSPNIIAIPLTSSLKKMGQPTHVYLPAGEETGLRKNSIALCENPECMSKECIGSYLTTIPREYMAQIAIGNLLATSAIAYIEPNKLLTVWQKSLSLNAAIA